MFRQFFVPPEEWTYLRFFWFRDNDSSKELVEYYACVHLQGLKGSPAIADVGRRFASRKSRPDLIEFRAHLECPYNKSGITLYLQDEIDMVMAMQFYVDDLLAANIYEERSIWILSGSKERLARHNIDLCKVSSNSLEITKRFGDSSPLPKEVEFSSEGMLRLEDPLEPDRNTSSLGLLWNTEEDTFRIKSKRLERPYTKRGLLALLMSPFDPPGFISPLLLKHKLLQRNIIPRKTDGSANMLKLDWDDPLPECIPEDESLHPDGCQCGRIRWKSLLDTLSLIDSISVTRSVLTDCELREGRLYGFADASEVAVCYAIYLRIVDWRGNVKVSLI